MGRAAERRGVFSGFEAGRPIEPASPAEMLPAGIAIRMEGDLPIGGLVARGRNLATTVGFVELDDRRIAVQPGESFELELPVGVRLFVASEGLIVIVG